MDDSAPTQIKEIFAESSIACASSLPSTDFLRDWLHHTAKQTVRERTFERHNEIIELHVLPLFGKVKLQKLTAQQVQRLYHQKAEQLAPATVRLIHIEEGRPVLQSNRNCLARKRA